MTSPEEAELEEIRRRKMAELQQRAAAEEARRREEAERAALMRAILTPEARQRLANVKVARPDLAEAVERQLIHLAQSGRLRGQVTDEMLRELLERLTPKRRETKIVRLSKDDLL
ncbi:MAG: DNA-binding protein [Thaumarchaeota archaeon]|nr:DNA-binding protein [Candidatus Calditenuaceae archaeon]MDW8187070.1 DNA-binding protein [Nitrososphaerota archaeon]